jgi:hypothetical protein
VPASQVMQWSKNSINEGLLCKCKNCNTFYYFSDDMLDSMYDSNNFENAINETVKSIYYNIVKIPTFQVLNDYNLNDIKKGELLQNIEDEHFYYYTNGIYYYIHEDDFFNIEVCQLLIKP